MKIWRGMKVWLWCRHASAALVSAAVLVVSICALWGWQAWQSRQRELTNAEILVTSLQRAAESQIDGSMRGIEFLLDEAADRVDPATWPAPAQLEWFRARLTGLPEISALIVADADGRVLGGPIAREPLKPPQAVGNIADRPYFMEAKTQFPARKLLIGSPLIGRFSGQTSIPVVRALSRPDGSFAGVVVASLQPSSLRAKLDSVLIKDDGVAIVFNTKAMFLARSPDHDNFIGRSIPESPLIRDNVMVNRSGVAHYRAVVDGVDKIAAYRTLERYPLVVVVGITRRAALAYWNRLMLVEGLALGVLSAALLAAAMLFDRRTAATLRLTAQLSASHAELERQVEERTAHLAATNAELEHFAYAASHDLQEPLRNVTGFLQLLQRRYRGTLDAQADEYIAFAVSAAKQMSTLIADVLTYSRIGGSEGLLEPTDATKLAKAAAESLAPEIQDAQASVEIAPLPVVRCHPGQVVSLFQNLISNAVKYREPGRPAAITIHAVPNHRPDLVEFLISDNGIGMEAQYLENIFGLFQRLHPRARFEGTGIGLALCRKIVERHQGRIWAESVVGQGTTIHFTLPLAELARPPAQAILV